MLIRPVFQSLRPLGFIFFLCALLPRPALPVSCTVAKQQPQTPAETAFLNSEYEKSISLYREALAQKPNDPQLTAKLVEVLLHQQRVSEASDTVSKALAANPDSALLESELGFVQFRAGMPWVAIETVKKANKLDPCNARSRLLTVYLLRLSSMYKSGYTELKMAHLLDPYDRDIVDAWSSTLPLADRIKAAEAVLSSPNGLDADEMKQERLYLEHLKKVSSEPKHFCRLVSQQTSTEIPFARLMWDANRLRAYGLDVKLNDHNARLEIDTGAGGLLISRSIARQAGLQQFSATEVGGVGSSGDQAAFHTFADSIKIGSLEFHDCAVTVLDRKNVLDSDGLIGMDVFSDLLVTLDYPMRKVVLGPLPPRPDEVAAAPVLATNEEENAVKEDSETDTDKKTANSGPHDRYVAPEMKDWTRVYRMGHDLFLPAALNQSTMKLFILDTGAFSTTVSPEAAREVTKVHRDYDMKVKGLSGDIDKVYNTGKIEFAFANLRQPTNGVTSLDTSNISKNMGIEISGFIGINTLGQLRTSIDYRDGLVKFEYDPKRGYQSPF